MYQLSDGHVKLFSVIYHSTELEKKSSQAILHVFVIKVSDFD